MGKRAHTEAGFLKEECSDVGHEYDEELARQQEVEGGGVFQREAITHAKT